MNYVLITPVKDEEENLPRLADCVVNQTILPKFWLIVDDYSCDNTPLIIEKLKKEFSWIESLRLGVPYQRNLDEHFGQVYNLAFRYAIRYCKEKNLLVDFFVKVDADIIFCEDCVERIFLRFIDDERLGVASPHVADVPTNAPFELQKLLKYATFKQNDAYHDYLLEPSDGLRVYRREAFEDIGGIPETMVPDVIAVAKAKQKGWRVMRFRDIIAFKTRKTGTSIPDKDKLKGLRLYYLDYHPLIMMLNVALEVRKGHIGRAVMILMGYVDGVIKKKEKIKDEKIKEYFRKIRLKEIVYSIWKRVS